MSEVRLLPVVGLPEITPGADLAGQIVAALARAGSPITTGDVLVVTHKIVAKAEGALVDLRTISPSPFAEQYARRWEKDPRHIEVVLRESARIVRMDHGVLICETRHGFICANAGVDASNMVGEDTVCTLPLDPDASARRIMEGVRLATGHSIAAIVCDTFGRPWREGLTNVALGVAGLQPLHSYIGAPDAQGRELRVSVMATADELASAAELVMGKLERVPAALIRGFAYEPGEGSGRELLRKPELDLFR